MDFQNANSLNMKLSSRVIYDRSQLVIHALLEAVQNIRNSDPIANDSHADLRLRLRVEEQNHAEWHDLPGNF